MNIEKTVRSLELRGFKVSRFATGKEAADYLAGALKGQTVGIGGSKTVEQIGLYDRLGRARLSGTGKFPETPPTPQPLRRTPTSPAPTPSAKTGKSSTSTARATACPASYSAIKRSMCSAA